MNCDEERYLTQGHKDAVLAEWETQITAGPLDGPGGPDLAIVPWCARLNTIPGVCTLQSCAGHRRGEVYETAHLWLWLDEATSRAWDRRAFELASLPVIESVERKYSSWGQEIHSVYFKGEEWGRLTESMLAIEGFVAFLG